MVLPALTVLNPRYAVRRSLGEPGPFSITYLGWDIETEEQVLIQEYLPAALAHRAEDETSVVVGDDEKQAALFQTGLKYFLKEAMVLSEVEHPHVIPERAPFEAMGTAYRVREHRPGMTLAKGIEKKGGLSERAALTIVDSILDALETTHQRGLLHGGVSPEAIHLMKNGHALLHDFRSAFIQLARRSDRLTDAVRPGTSAPEQYAAKGKQGPWTDVYACAATVCQIVTGEVIPVAPARLEADPMAALLEDGDRFTPAVRDVLLQALTLDPRERIRSAQAFRQQLQDALTAPQEPPQLTRVETPSEEEPLAEDAEKSGMEASEADADEPENVTSESVEADQPVAEHEATQSDEAESDSPEAADERTKTEENASDAVSAPVEEASADASSVEVGPENKTPADEEAGDAAEKADEVLSHGEEAPAEDQGDETQKDAVADAPSDDVSEVEESEEESAEAPSSTLESVLSGEAVAESASEEENGPDEDEAAPVTDEVASESAADAPSPEEADAAASDRALGEGAFGEEGEASAGGVPDADTSDAEPVPVAESDEAPADAADEETDASERPDRPPAPPSSSDDETRKKVAEARRNRLVTRVAIPLLLFVIAGAVLVAWTTPWNNTPSASPYTALRAYGDSLFARADYSGAKSFYIQALEVRPEDEYVAGRLEEVKQIQVEKLDAQYNRQLEQGDALAMTADSLLSEEDLSGAIAAFEEAQAAYRAGYEVRPNDAVIADRIQEVDSLLVSVREVNNQQETSERMYTLFRQQGDEQFAARNYRVAGRKYREALDYRPEDAYLQEQLDAVNRLLAEQEADQQYAALIAQGDSLFQAERYTEARIQYNRALEIRPQDSLASAQLTAIDDVLAERDQRERQFQYHRGRGDGYFEQGEYQDAIESYRKALEYRPGDAYVSDQIAASEEALAEQQREAERRRQAIQQQAEALRQQRVQDDGVYTAVDTEPVLIGGLAGLHSEVQYPPEAIDARVEGRVYLEVVVDTDGSVREASVTKGIGSGCDQEALRVVRQAEFQPARLDGEPVPYRHALWIQFQLEERQLQQEDEKR